MKTCAYFKTINCSHAKSTHRKPTYFQNCALVLFNKYAIFDRVVYHFNITQCICDRIWCVWITFIDEATL